MLTEYLRHVTRGLTTRLGQWVGDLGIHPNAITVASLFPTAIAALIAAGGQFFLAGLVLLIGAPLDALDGAVARATNQQSRFGALLDSTTDRYADGFMFFGLAVYFATQQQLAEMALAIAALIGAYAVSYVRARAEGLDIGSIREGWFDRVVRLIVLIVALLTGWVVPGLVILAVGSHATAVQRLFIAYQATRDD
jgi:CDP-diacylglycerol--glycerol-3-phosphate 3-phosphatidyltransferase